MATPPSNNHFEAGACLPCCTSVGQSQGTQIIVPIVTNDTGNPDGNSPMKQTEHLLASEMSKMSVQERSNALYDVHCVGENFNETLEIVQKSLADFEQAVQTLLLHTNHHHHHHHRSIYEMAMNQNRAFVEDPDFRLKFLRANSHDVDKSVRQMMAFLQYKAKYFGLDKLTCEIGISDLTDVEIDLMLSMYHIQKGRDRMGRVIVHNIYNLKTDSSADRVDTWIRASYYFCWNILLAIPDVQLNGAATIVHNAFKLHGIGFLKELTPFCNSLPVRWSAIHIPHENSSARNYPGFDGLFSFILKSVQRHARVRTRIHLGSHMEIQYELRRHGIPCDTFPLDEDGNIREDIRNLWFQKHPQEINQTFHRSEVARAVSPRNRSLGNQLLSYGDGVGNALLQFGQIDDQRWSSIQNNSDANRQSNNETGGSENSENVVCNSLDYRTNGKRAFPDPGHNKIPTTCKRLIKPTPKDVLLGRGRGFHDHPGNVRFREFLQDYQEEYNNSPRYQRVKSSRELTQRLLEDGVRFLRMTERGRDWEEIDFSEAENKVKQVFRSRRKMKKKI